MYLTERDTVREGTTAGGGAEGEEDEEADSLLSGEPNVGFEPRTPRS